MTVDDLHETFQESLQGYAFKLGRDGDLADDLVQETFVRVLGHLDLLAQLNRHQQRAWLYQTLKRLYLDRRAAHQRQATLVERYTLEVDETTQTDSTTGFNLFDLVPEADRDPDRKTLPTGFKQPRNRRRIGHSCRHRALATAPRGQTIAGKETQIPLSQGEPP